MDITSTLVSLVGAGPGDPKLLSIAAIERLRQADAVFYDALVNPIILSYCRQGIERIPVGKRCGKHSHEQDSINALLIERALSRGGRIVRLKGGDPFVFGRGGEEVLDLIKHKIPFEVVPGITAGVAVSTYTGVPVTHRGVSRSVTFITASTKEHKVEATSWRAMVELGGTLVFYMGSTVIPAICRLLYEAGMSPDTPACVTTDGTLPSQRTIFGPIGSFTPDYTDYSKLSPGLFIVGNVVSFHNDFSFFAPSPLEQAKVLCVSVDTERSSLADLLGEKVAYVHTLPTSKNAPLPLPSQLLDQVKALPQGAWIAFTTTAAVDYFMGAIKAQGGDARTLAHLNIAAIGHTTEKRLASLSLRADFVPQQRDLGGFAAEFQQRLSSHTSILLPYKEGELPQLFVEKMQEYEVIALPLYHDVPIEYCADDITFLRDIAFTHVTFTSTKAVEQFARLLDRYPLHELTTQAEVIALGAATRDALTAHGITTNCFIKKGTMQQIADHIEKSL